MMFLQTLLQLVDKNWNAHMIMKCNTKLKAYNVYYLLCHRYTRTAVLGLSSCGRLGTVGFDYSVQLRKHS